MRQFSHVAESQGTVQSQLAEFESFDSTCKVCACVCEGWREGEREGKHVLGALEEKRGEKE